MISCCSDDVDDRILLKGHRLTDLVVDFDPDVVRVELRERGSAVEIAVGAADASGVAHRRIRNLDRFHIGTVLIRTCGLLVNHWGRVARQVRYAPVKLRTRKPCWLRMRAAM